VGSSPVKIEASRVAWSSAFSLTGCPCQSVSRYDENSNAFSTTCSGTSPCFDYAIQDVTDQSQPGPALALGNHRLVGFVLAWLHSCAPPRGRDINLVCSKQANGGVPDFVTEHPKDAEVVKTTTGMLFSVGLSLDFLQNLPAVFLRQVQIKQDQIRARSVGVLTLTIH
jgi:hypothetical protein